MSLNDSPTAHHHVLPPPDGSVVPPIGIDAMECAGGIEDAPFDKVVVAHLAIAEAGDPLSWLDG